MNEDLSGRKINKLTVLRKSNQRHTDGRILWICLCDCGNIVRRLSSHLTNDRSKSCGQCNQIFDQNQYIEHDNYIMGLTRNGEKFYFDKLDFNRIIEHTWHKDGYITSYTAGRLHNFLMQPQDGELVDHRDGDPMNNRRNNLRICNSRQNSMNQLIHKDNKSGYKGVCFHCGKWQSSIASKGKTYYLGRFDSKEDAAEAYNLKAIELFGEFAKLNIIKKEWKK